MGRQQSIAPTLAGCCGMKSYHWAHWERQPQGPWALVTCSAQRSGCQQCPLWRPFCGMFFIPSACTLQVRGPLAFLFSSPSLLLSPPHRLRGIFTVYFWEYRGRVERGPAFTQDVSPKYFNLVQTSKLVFSFFSLSHPFLEAKSKEQPNYLNMGWGWVQGWEDRREPLGGKKLVIISKMFPVALRLLALDPPPTGRRTCCLLVL